MCFEFVGPLENHVKTMAKCRYRRGNLGGLGHRLGILSVYVIFQTVFGNIAKTLATNEFVELILILALSSQTLKSTHVQTL